MTSYRGTGQAQLVRANQQVFLFQNATNVTGRASIALQLERVNRTFTPWGMSFQVYFTDANGSPADPGAFAIDIQASDIDEDSQYSAINEWSGATALNGDFVGRIDVPVYAKYIRAVVKTLTNPVNVTLLATFSGGVSSSASGGGGGGMVWPPAGVAVSTGTSWSASIDPATVPRLNTSNTFTQPINASYFYATSYAVVAPSIAGTEIDFYSNIGRIIPRSGTSIVPSIQLTGWSSTTGLTYLNCTPTGCTFGTPVAVPGTLTAGNATVTGDLTVNGTINNVLPLTLTAPTTVATGTNNLTIAGSATGTNAGIISLGASNLAYAVTIRQGQTGGDYGSSLQWRSSFLTGSSDLNTLQTTYGNGNFVAATNSPNAPPQLAGQNFFGMFTNTESGYQLQTAWNSRDTSTVTRVFIRSIKQPTTTWSPWVELLHDDGAGSVAVTGNLNVNGNAAASTSPLLLTGTVFTGGTGTTTVPQVYLNSGAVAPTTWSTAGTLLGMNAPAGFTGNLLDFKINGATASVFSVNSAGALLGAGGNQSVYANFSVYGNPPTVAQAYFVSNGLRLINTFTLGWGSGGNAQSTVVDVAFSRVSAATLQLQGATSATPGNLNITGNLDVTGTITKAGAPVGVQIILAPDQATAVSLSTANPNNFYFWV